MPVDGTPDPSSSPPISVSSSTSTSTAPTVGVRKLNIANQPTSLLTDFENTRTPSSPLAATHIDAGRRGPGSSPRGGSSTFPPPHPERSHSIGGLLLPGGLTSTSGPVNTIPYHTTGSGSESYRSRSSRRSSRTSRTSRASRAAPPPHAPPKEKLAYALLATDDGGLTDDAVEQILHLLSGVPGEERDQLLSTALREARQIEDLEEEEGDDWPEVRTW